jgi:hypothetical protein
MKRVFAERRARLTSSCSRPVSELKDLRRVNRNGKVPMKIKLAMALGISVGTAAYQVIRYGASELDVARTLFIALIAFLVLLLIPNRWFEKSRS